MLNIKIEIDDSAFKQRLNELEQRLSDLTPAMRAIGVMLEGSVRKNFEVGGRYSESGSWKGGSRKWVPLSPATIEKKSGLGNTLIDTGKLMNSIRSSVSDNGVEIGIDGIDYALIHNFGGHMGRGLGVNIPARPFMVIQAEDLEMAREIITDHILGR